MSGSKYLKISLLILLILLIATGITASMTRSRSGLISGFVSILKTDSHKHYHDTLINSYDPELSWGFSERWGTSGQPEIAGVSGLLVDANSGKILFEKSAFERRKIASLTKIMTAVIALEHKSIDSKIYISQKAASIGENSMGLSAGETYSLEELLYGLVLHSGNDAAYAIAEGVAGDSDRFVEWMNFKAKELGLNDTYFACPSGLNDETYSTPADLARLTRYALKNPTFREIVKTMNKEIIGDTHKYLYLENQTNLLSTYPGVAGVKTGFTEEAGLCLVTYANNEGREVVGVVLNSIDRKGDMVLMLDHGFSTLGVAVEHHLLDY